MVPLGWEFIYCLDWSLVLPDRILAKLERRSLHFLQIGSNFRKKSAKLSGKPAGNQFL
jgi:hypothetical protein